MVIIIIIGSLFRNFRFFEEEEPEGKFQFLTK